MSSPRPPAVSGLGILRTLRFGGVLPAPLRRPSFRRLWVGMSLSYAGDRFQVLAQGWLVATITQSALGVGLISALGLLPLLLLPIGGAIVERMDRRRTLLVIQLAGAGVTALVTGLVLTGHFALWHIYAWSLLNGLGTLLARPAYKVVLTEAVPPDELRSAVAINSVSETASLTLTNAGGSLILAWLGLPVAFLLNTVSYLVAALSLWSLPAIGHLPVDDRHRLTPRVVLSDLRDGVRYLIRRPEIFHPLLLTFATIALAGPIVAVLPAIVQAVGGSIVDLGVLAAGMNLGGLGGAAFAGTHSEGASATRLYALMGLVAALAVALFVWLPTGIAQFVALAAIGFVAFAQAVWNTSRIRQLADPPYQARLQAITSMAFTLGFLAGALWAGVAIDQQGNSGLLLGAAVLAIGSTASLVRFSGTRTTQRAG